MKFIKYFDEIGLKDINLVGGKNASLGEMIQNLGTDTLRIPFGFAITTAGYFHHIQSNNLDHTITQELAKLSASYTPSLLNEVGTHIRSAITQAPLPADLIAEITQAYITLCNYYHTSDLDIAIRSSATAEDLPTASFAGQQDTYLNVSGIDAIVPLCKAAMASLFTNRALSYRIEQGFENTNIGISIGIQKMVRSDKACSGVLFSIDTESGFKDALIINSSYGLGETLVQGLVTPDEFHVHKPTLRQGYKPIIKKQVGTKHTKLIYSTTHNQTTLQVPVEIHEQEIFSLTDAEILELARMGLIIEDYYCQARNYWSAMDIEWAKDGIDHQLYIVQARPETFHSQSINKDQLTRYHLDDSSAQPLVLTTGHSIGHKISSGTARLLSIEDADLFNEGDILVTPMTDPDWVPLMKKASAIITDNGGRTCHAAIVSRELGVPALVGTGNATKTLHEGQSITVDCSQGSLGYVYDGLVPFSKQVTTLTHLPQAPVDILINIANPDSAYEHSFLPVAGVGLARLEFIITNFIQVHPMAICHPEKIQDPQLKGKIDALASAYDSWQEFFISTLAQGVATIAAAFYPRRVVVRLTDFKSNEYRNLLGGSLFEPLEENPMLGFRGAIRYCNPAYAPAFALECAALKKVRTEMGLTNVTLMVPFVRTTLEAACTVESLKSHGLVRGEDGLKLLMMCEIPSNILLLEEFSQYFDGFSIGSNDLTQLTLGVDRDSALLSNFFDERDPAVLAFLLLALEKARKIGTSMSICGQAPSDFPEIGELLINNGIDALSLNPDSVIAFILRFQR